MFVGQRKEGFSVNVGQLFDTLNLAPAGTERVANVLGPQEQGANDLENKNITTNAVETPKACLTKDASSPIIGAKCGATDRSNSCPVCVDHGECSPSSSLPDHDATDDGAYAVLFE